MQDLLLPFCSLFNCLILLDTSKVRKGGNILEKGFLFQQDAGHPGLRPKRFHGSVVLETTRVGRDAGRIADEVITHLAGLVGSRVKVTLEIEAEIPTGAPKNVVRVVTKNSRTLKFVSQGFEKE